MESYGVSWSLMGVHGVLWSFMGSAIPERDVRGKGRVSIFVTKRYRREVGDQKGSI